MSIISWLQLTSEVILEPPKIKSVTVSIVSPSICHEVMWSEGMSSFFECWVLSQSFHFPLSPSSRGSLLPLHFLPLRWCHKHILEKAMGTHSSTLTWKIPWMEELGRLWVRHDWMTSLSLFTFMHWWRMAIHSSVLAWKMPGMREPGGLLSMELHKVRHNWSDLAAAAA